MDIADRYNKIRQKISELSEKTKKHTELIVVSKNRSVECIKVVYDLGQIWFGENYCDELIEKSAEVKKRHLAIKWTFIGNLQSNKIAKIVEHSDEIQSAYTQKHFKFINRYAAEFKKINFPVFILVNIEDEPQKSGCKFDEVKNLADFIADQCPALKLVGLMAIPPAKYNDDDCTEPPESYLKLRAEANYVGAKKLSLGMSQDLALAMTSGTDFVRVGTEIFGPI